MRHLLPLVLLLSACEPPPPPIPGEIERTGETLATVNGQPVTQGMVDVVLAKLPPQQRDQIIARGQVGQVKDRLVVDELLYQEAVKQGMHDDPEVKKQIALVERQALAAALMEKVVKERTTDEAVKKWYDEHAVQFRREQVKVRRIVTKEKAEAEAVLAQLKGGADFATLAKEKSIDPGSAKEGGDLNWLDKSPKLPAELRDGLFTAEKGALVGPVESPTGWMVFKVEDKRDAVPVEEVSDKIKNQLQNEIAQAYVDELKKTAQIGTPGATGGTPTVNPADVQTDTKPAGAPTAPH